jgi:hypothetical protein
MFDTASLQEEEINDVYQLLEYPEYSNTVLYILFFVMLCKYCAYYIGNVFRSPPLCEQDLD